ncbi:MAG: glycoside hydrolase family 127 protein [Verrucomicrobia bacterium]|nr:glycoside hydrolase family 127 protein [Verrucomicrobiota bacterium]
MKATHALLLSVLAVATATSVAGAVEPTTTGTVNYARPFEPPTRPAFIALPPGAVEPGGWLRDWCLAARDGFTGHMDEVHQEFQRAWAVDHTMTGERLNWPKGAWPYEGGGYWFDGLVRLGYALHDDALIQQAKRRLDVVVNNMNTNSILFLWWLNKNNPNDMKAVASGGYWSIWASGLLGRALVGYYAGSGDQRVLQTLETAYGGNRDWLGWGMSNPWPAFDTYTWTGNKEIAAALTTLFAKDGGGKNPGGASWNRYRQMPDLKPGAEKNDHVVHFLESTTPWALGYLWTGNREFLDATLAWHDLLERDSMQPSGVPVADEFYGPTGAYRGTETCDVAGYVWSQIALLTVSGQGRMADRAERAFFNAGPATVARDFKTHVYFQSPNRIADKCPPYPHGPKAEGNSYAPTHYPLCCTAALNRIVPNYVMHMWMATYDNGLAATHYGPCKVSALVADRVPVELTCQTDYPFNDVITMTVKPARAATFLLSFRIPGWCKNPELSVNGSALKAANDTNGFVRVERLWKTGDTIRLRFPMSASVQTGRDNNAQGAPYASVSYGPLLFALPIPDTKDENTPDPAAKWNYALDVQKAGISVERQTMPAKWDWPLKAPLKLRVNAVRCDWSPTPQNPLPVEPVARLKSPERITLVPYGCAKFRVSMFPVTERAWSLSEAQGRKETK